MTDPTPDPGSAPDPAPDPGTELAVRLADPSETGDALAVLNAAYERTSFTEDWYRWKHLECPWGPSRPYVAEAPDGRAGVVFALPWRFRRHGAEIEGARFVDGGTLPAARGRRALGRMCGAELASWGTDHDRPGVLLATATPAAQKSHARNGAVTLDPIVAAYGLPRVPLPARLRRDESVLDEVVLDDGPLLSTSWTPEALRWRIDERSGHRYEVAALASADAAGGIVYRVTSAKGIRILCPTFTWGTAREIDRLVGAVCVAAKCVAVLAPHGPGTPPSGIRPVRPSGSTIMCVWDWTGVARPAEAVTDWRLCMADIEGLI